MSSISSKAMADSSILTGPRILVPPGPTPSILDKYFDFLEWSPGCDKLLVGTSDLTSRSWGGSIWLFSDKQCQSVNTSDGWKPLAEQCLVGAQLDCGATVGKFLRCSDKFIIGCDSGSVQVLGIKSTTAVQPQKSIQIEGHASMAGHDDVVLDLDDLGGHGLHYVSCSQDKCIKIWDLERFVTTHNFSPAHGHIVTCVRARPSQPECFASCSRDGSALLWDSRDEFPASSLISPNGIGLTSVSWLDEMIVVVGSVGGQLSSIDIRNVNQSQSKIQLDKRPVHLMKSIPNYESSIATCQDNSKISVVDFGGDAPKVMYANDQHGDFVRGLAWNQCSQSLWSCGWDSKIISHHLKSTANGVL